jgi:hypothetical protein
MVLPVVPLELGTFVGANIVAGKSIATAGSVDSEAILSAAAGSLGTGSGRGAPVRWDAV